MAENKDSKSGNAGGVNSAERTKKAAATRAITSAKVAKLSGEDHYVYTKLSILRSAIERLQAHILDGGHGTGELAEACGELDKKIGQSFFA